MSIIIQDTWLRRTGSTLSTRIPATDNAIIGGTTPDTSTVFQLDSTTRGFLPPRLTTVERDAVGAPATGLTVYNTTTSQKEFFNGARWGATSANIGPRQFDATVDANGNGDFTSIVAAFSAGNRQVFVRQGVYIEPADIVIPNSGALVGEFAGAVIILPAAGFGVTMDGSGRRTTAGSASATNGSAIVTGIGTSFTTLLPGDFALLNGIFHEISVITNNTTLTLDKVYRGKSFAPIAFEGQSMFLGARLDNVIVTLTTVSALQITQVFFPIVTSCLFDACGSLINPSVTCVDSSGLLLFGAVAQDAPGVGFDFLRVQGASLADTIAKNNVGRGYSFRDSRIITVSECLSTQNNDDGFFVDLDCAEIGFGTCASIQNNADGFQTAAASIITFTGCIACNNTLVGMNLASDNTLVVGCDVKNNSGRGIVAPLNSTINGCNVSANVGGIDASGASGVVISNNFLRNNNVSGGIILGDDCQATGNHLFNNTGIGISVPNKDNCVIVGNRVRGSTTDGINIAVGSTDTILGDNNALGNTGTDIVDNGIGTSRSNNKPAP